MATQLSQRLPWLKSPIYLEQYEEDATIKRLRRTIEESRKVFLNLTENSATKEPLQQQQQQKQQQIQPQSQNVPPDRRQKKISFKIKKTASVYRRKEKDKLSSNSVQELARKYNELVEKSTTGGVDAHHPQIARLVKRVNSQRSERKKPCIIQPDGGSKPHQTKRRVSIKRSDSARHCHRTHGNVELAASSGPSTVRQTIAIFERKCEKMPASSKPKVPEKTFDVKHIALRNQEKQMRIKESGRLQKKQRVVEEEQQLSNNAELIMQVVSIPLTPPKKCDSKYETMHLKRIAANHISKPSEEHNTTKEDDATIRTTTPTPPSSQVVSDYDVVSPQITLTPPENDETKTDDVDTTIVQPPIPPRVLPFCTTDDDYEICDNPEENIYETLPSPEKLPTAPTLSRRKEEPLPPRPSSACSNDLESNFYESIDCKKSSDDESNYESIYHIDWHTNNKRDSILSDQQSNSIYGRSITSWAEDILNTYIGKTGSDLSGSSDDWVDLSDHDDEETGKNSGFVIVRERQKLTKKTSGWSQQIREQWNKVPQKAYDQGDSDSDHHYESLYSGEDGVHHHQEVNDDDYDSFDSDSESDNSFAKNDSGVDMGNTQLPETPNNQTYVLTRLAATAGKHMKKLRRNWSLTKNDITKSLSRMARRKSRSDLSSFDNKPKIDKDKSLSLSTENDLAHAETSPYQNMHVVHSQESLDSDRNKSISRKGFLKKFRKSISISGDLAELNANSSSTDKSKSTFYLTPTIEVDRKQQADVQQLLNPPPKVNPRSKSNLVRPQIPPPPAPTTQQPSPELRKTKRSTSWYAECGLFKNSEQIHNLHKRPNTYWYAEVGLYQSNSTPSTSSSENSGTNTNDIIKPDSDDYYNMQNESDYYNDSIRSNESANNKNSSETIPDLQLRLQDEPLYQFYDAAILESVYQDGISEYETYEEVENKVIKSCITTRPSAMELITPNLNNVSVARTLWCEIPEVIQSAVLSSLSTHQMKLQEAKFEMLTSEASYLNSLNVLIDHFYKNLKDCDILSKDEKDILFTKVFPVKKCSEKLLLDLEKCWQDNILLHGICDIIKSHAENNFHVYVSYCENQIILDQTLKKLKENPAIMEVLRKLESSNVCQLLSLHSFLMLPMQRITRWPLLVDAVLKRLSAQDEEYLSCQYALATLNKTVMQCNEGARNMERKTEMQKIAQQIEFGKSVPCFELLTGTRWLVRSGPLIQMQSRGDDVKLTFGKRFTKIPLHLYLFNDVLVVTKGKGDGTYIIQHYCSRSYLEIISDTLAYLPTKDTQGRHLIFLTILENHEGKTVEMLLSCNSETDKERWLEALTPPKSENPDETLYECWDCPQVTAVHNYSADQPDELALCRGDIINVTRKMADGWYHGERIRDGQIGWFPANYTVEVVNPHVRARNLKQRYRLLAFSENYLRTK